MGNGQVKSMPLVLMIVVVNRGKGHRLSEILADDGVFFSLMSLGKGTAPKKMLSYLGLGEQDKELLYSAMPYNLSRGILEKIDKEMKLYKPGKGVAFCIGAHAELALSDDKSENLFQNEGGSSMEQNQEGYELIVVVTNQGYADEVMDVAREAGATGGTVIHARGQGIKQAEKFFGVSVQPEKDMLFIIAKRSVSAQIMSAVINKDGLKDEARTILFSLPVNGVAGLSDYNGDKI